MNLSALTINKNLLGVDGFKSIYGGRSAEELLTKVKYAHLQS